MARSILSFGMFSARALRMARRSRAFMSGSGAPSLAATVISRASLENSFERRTSAAPLRCMMFLNWEWPAMFFLAKPAGLYGCVRLKGSFSGALGEPLNPTAHLSGDGKRCRDQRMAAARKYEVIGVVEIGEVNTNCGFQQSVGPAGETEHRTGDRSLYDRRTAEHHRAVRPARLEGEGRHQFALLIGRQVVQDEVHRGVRVGTDGSAGKDLQHIGNG